MNSSRMEEILNATNYPDSPSVKLALRAVWYETAKVSEAKITEQEREIKRLENLVQGRDIDGVLIPGKPLQQL
jgi:hypothetical protein